MSIFLMVLLSVVIVIGLLILFVVVWLRSKLRKAVGNYKTLAPFLIRHSARLTLRIESLPSRSDVDEDTAAQLTAMGKLWSELSAQGVKRLGTLASSDDHMFIVGQHPENKLVALVACLPGAAPYIEFMILSATSAARVLTGEPGARALQLASLTVETTTVPTFAMALKAMTAHLPARALDLRMLILLMERVHATRMDSQLAHAPTLADMRAQAAQRGVTEALDLDGEQRALDINRDAWLEALRISLLDNGRRKLKLEEEPWGRLADELIVVHQAMNADEVIATLSGHDLVGQLGEQLKKQKFGPAQIFDEINRRLGDDDQRHLVLQLGIPVTARLFARASVLQAAGVPAQAVPA
ncbi:MAG: hypothetical protein V4484_11430 [Pseudomonadota bacterium]